VPVAEFTLADGEVIFFEQHTLLWKERTVALTGKNLKQRGQRTVAGMPHAVLEARGPGRIAVTRDASGEVVVPTSRGTRSARTEAGGTGTPTRSAGAPPARNASLCTRKVS
jgi:uncharacterized protein (AIM24 family)